MIALDTGIRTLFNALGRAEVIYKDRADEKAAAPFLVFTTEGESEPLFGAVLETYKLTLTVWTLSSSPLSVGAIADAVAGQFDDSEGTLAVVGYSVVSVTRTGRDSGVDEEGYHWEELAYSVILEK